MALQEPVAIYTAETNNEAEVVRHALKQSGVEAYITEDLSVVGLFWGGTLPGIHTPKVWVDQADAPRAAVLLAAYEKHKAEEVLVEGSATPETGDIEVACEGCGKPSYFPASAKGNVEMCPHCGSYLDVGEDEADDADEDWGEAEKDDAEESKEE